LDVKRPFVRGVLIAGAALSMAAGGQAQQDGQKAVQMRTLSVYDILYVITAGGGNSGALLTDQGSVLVDTKLPGWGQPVREAVEAVTDQPVTLVINTHAHADHTGSNGEFPTASDIVAHENTKANMARMTEFSGGNARFLPNRTFTDRLSLDAGGDPIDVYYFGRGHTNGDAIVVFRRQRVAFMGDLFPEKGAPIIDRKNGGSGVDLPDTLAKAVAEIKDVDRVIVGHSTGGASLSFRALRWSDLQEYAQFTRDFLTAVQAAVKAGKSVDEAVASLNLSEKYNSYDMQPAKMAVQAIYDEIGK
jgi:glyoxylase-like metal-dependent hydrolase (beta-lactamase superfamily II)